MIDEGRVLDGFWSRVEGGDRLALLRELAEIRIVRPDDWEGGEVRFGMATTTQRLTGDQCYACLTSERYLYWHHVIQVQHGGSNDARNFVRLCHACHRRVHPWLPVPTSLENWRGWTSVADIARRTEVRLVRMVDAREVEPENWR